MHMAYRPVRNVAVIFARIAPTRGAAGCDAMPGKNQMLNVEMKSAALIAARISDKPASPA